MNFRKCLYCVAIVIALISITSSLYAMDKNFNPQMVYGPRFEKLCMVIIRNSDSQILAAQRGDVDILGEIVLPSDIDRLSNDPKLSMSLARGFHAFFLLLNNKTEPWNNKYVRQAVAEAIDRNNIVRTIYSGYCEPITTWVPPVSPWALKESGKIKFDRKNAREKLKKAGYTWNLTGRLITPEGKVVPKLKMLTPLARVAPTTAELAEQIADSLNAIGFPVDVEPMDFSAMIAKLDRKDYSLAVLAWGMGRNPDSLYSFYHSAMDVNGGYNVTGINDKKLDKALYSLRFAKNKKEAEKFSKESQELLVDLVPSIPIYSRFSVAAVSKSLKNVLMTDTITADNIWTILMAEPKDPKKKVLNMLLAEEPRNMNLFVASSAYTWQVLGMIYEGMISTNPFTLEDMPGLAEKWEIKTVNGEKSKSTKLIFYFKKGLKWNDSSSLTAHDMKATIDFLTKNKIPRFYDAVKEVKSTVVINDTKLEVVLNGVSYWNLDRIGGLPCIPKKVLDNIKDWQSWDPLDKSEKFGPYGLIGCGPYVLDEYKRGEFVMMKRNVYYRMLSNKRNLK
ncbi:MAG: ABC transporter substrate-binding protein [Synergistaceae bacterium]